MFNALVASISSRHDRKMYLFTRIGVFLHVVADTLGSVGVIISSLLIQQYKWYIADPICSLFIAVMIFVSVIPLLKQSSHVLLLKTPDDVRLSVREALKKVCHFYFFLDILSGRRCLQKTMLFLLFPKSRK